MPVNDILTPAQETANRIANQYDHVEAYLRAYFTNTTNELANTSDDVLAALGARGPDLTTRLSAMADFINAVEPRIQVDPANLGKLTTGGGVLTKNLAQAGVVTPG